MHKFLLRRRLFFLLLKRLFFVWEGTLRRGQLYANGSSGTRLTQSFFFFVSLHNSQNPVCHFGHCKAGNEEHPQQLKISYLSANTSAQLGYGQGFPFRLFYIYSCWTEQSFHCLFLQILKSFWSFSQPGRCDCTNDILLSSKPLPGYSLISLDLPE